MLNKKSRYLLITMLVFLSIAFDQISKIWVRNNFESYSEKSIIGDVFTLIKVENTGAFLGMGSELSGNSKDFIINYITCYCFNINNLVHLH
jgi:signal peptidase II